MQTGLAKEETFAHTYFYSLFLVCKLAAHTFQVADHYQGTKSTDILLNADYQTKVAAFGTPKIYKQKKWTMKELCGKYEHGVRMLFCSDIPFTTRRVLFAFILLQTAQTSKRLLV